MLRAALLCALAAPAAAQTCMPLPAVIESLTDQWGEAPVGQGLSNGGAIVTVWTIPVTGTWTITVTHPDGTTCLIGAGTAFATLAPVRPPNT